MNRQRNALALVGLLATAALATENIVVGGDGSGATWQEAAAVAPVIDFSTRTEQLDHRLDAIERAIADVRQDIRELRAGHRWIIGILFGVVGLQITILLKVLN